MLLCVIFPLTALGAAPAAATDWVRGMDVSYWQGPNIDWKKAKEQGARFVFIKSSEGTYSVGDLYKEQRDGARSAGLLTGPYHLANPAKKYGTVHQQVEFFAKHSDNYHWKSGAGLLPPMVDFDPGDSDDGKCYGLTQPEMVSWMHEFLKGVTERLGRAPVVYSNPDWWATCAGDSSEFGDYDLTLAKWEKDTVSGPGQLLPGWDRWTFWQHWDHADGYEGPGELLPGDQQLFNGTEAELISFANEVSGD